MIRRIMGGVFVVIGGLLLLGQVMRGFSMTPGGGAGPRYGHAASYAAGYRVGVIIGTIIALLMLLGGLYLVLSNSGRSDPEPERRRIKKRRKIVLPKPLDD